MSEIKEPVIFEPESVPRRRPIRSRSKLRPSLRCCLLCLAAIGGIFISLILYIVLKSSVQAAIAITSPHWASVHKPDQDQSFIPPIKPILNSTDQFDILTTVWLDVTQHLKEGGTLPENIHHVQYKHPNGQLRSEAILYTDILFKGLSMQSPMQHTSVPIKVPIEPLYTQSLGPATLRATFQMIPYSSPQGHIFQNASSIYPAFLPIGPRSPDSLLLRTPKGGFFSSKEVKPTTLLEAMEYSAINVNLLALLKSNIQLNDTEVNLRDDHLTYSAFYDGLSSNRAFIDTRLINDSSPYDKERIDTVITEDHRIGIPHVRTRSRIVLIKEDRDFTTIKYMPIFSQNREQLQDGCSQFKDKYDSPPNAGPLKQCLRPFQASIHENMLEFEEEKSLLSTGKIQSIGRINKFYAPFLAQSGIPAAYRHHRTIPRYSPIAIDHEDQRDFPTSRKQKKNNEECLVPMLEIDESGEYFEFQWDVAFSSHIHMRASIGEHMVHDHKGSELEMINQDDGREIRIKYEAAEETYWNIMAFGLADKEHPNSKLWVGGIHLAFSIISSVVYMILTIGYWYTRTTSAGLSTRAQTLFVMPIVLTTATSILDLTDNAPISFANVLHMAVTLYSIYMIILVLSCVHHFDLAYDWSMSRRRPNKKERDTKRLDDQIGWVVPISLVLFGFLFSRYIAANDYAVIGGKGCHEYSPAKETQANRRVIERALFRHFSYGIKQAAATSQIYFNHRSKTFAGSFKIYVYIASFLECFNSAVKRYESVSGWTHSRPPTTVPEVFHLLINAILFYQVLAYSAIPQSLTQEQEE